jgi:iron complex transport system ATP-binding protein
LYPSAYNRAVLEMSGVSLRRNGRLLLENLSLQLPDPGTYLLAGPPASGKSLVGRMLSGRLGPDTGQVLLDGSSVYRSAGWRTLLRTPEKAPGPLFCAEAGQVADDSERLYSYLDVQLWRAGAAATALLPYWEVLEKAIADARKRSLASLSSSELGLAQLALGAAVPARVVVLDGQLGCLDANGIALAQKLIALTPVEERFVILTGPASCMEFGRARRLELNGELPVRLADTGAAG